jgi:hypothetical protein
MVAVNVGQAIATGNLGEYVFMVDTTGYSGNGSEGGNELVTTCTNGDTVIWNVVSIDPSETVAILGFSGEAIQNNMINPGQYPQYAGTVWGGRVNSAGTNVQYSMELLLQGNVQQSFDPFLTANNVQNLR